MNNFAASWPGNQADFESLIASINANCACPDDMYGQEVPSHMRCAAHKMLADQITLNHLAEAAVNIRNKAYIAAQAEGRNIGRHHQ